MFEKFIILFTIYSFLGFVWESFYCTIKTNTWQERGFLYGPMCPIYGCGACSMTLILRYFNEYLNKDVPYYYIKLFLIAFFGSMVLEYTTSFVLEKLFHASWWDYSDVPLNINGRISLPTTTAFGIAGIIVPEFIIPKVEKLVNIIPANFVEIIAFILTIIITVDFTLTISSLTDFAKYVNKMDMTFNENMNEVVEEIKIKGTNAKEKILEEKEKYIDENIKRLSDTKDFLYKGAVGRIKNFKYPTIRKIKIAEKFKKFLKK